MFQKLITILTLLSTFPLAFSEKEAVLSALSNSPSLQIKKVLLSTDSLGYRAASAKKKLGASISGNNAVHWQPSKQYEIGDSNFSENIFETNLGATISQPLSGGGELTGSLSHHSISLSDSQSAQHTSSGKVSFSQPLLKDAWSHAPIDYEIKIAAKHLSISKEAFRGQVLTLLSQVREEHLNTINLASQVSIRRLELTYANNTLEYERARFSLGEKAEMDTLSAALETLKAKETLLNANFKLKQARKQLALSLGIPFENLPSVSDTQITLNPIPAAEVIYTKIENAHHELKILDLTLEQLNLQVKKTQNALLPRVDLLGGVEHTQLGKAPFSHNNAPWGTRTFSPYIGVSFVYDIFSRQHKINQAQAKLKSHSTQLEKAFLLKQQKVIVDEFIDAWEQDMTRLNIRQAEVKIAEKNHAYAVARYQIGEIDNLAKLKAQSDLINAKLNLLSAKVNLKRLEIAVDKVTSHTLKRFGVNLQ